MQWVPFEQRVDIASLLGAVITTLSGMDDGSEEVVFTLADGRRLSMGHMQDCCEHVYLADVVGDPHALLTGPLLLAEECTSDSPDPGPLGTYDESYTWTYYRLGTSKGVVTLRWYGSSNGYYSESVDIIDITPKQ